MWAIGRPPRRRPLLDAIDGGFFVFSTLASTWLAYVLLRDGVQHGWQALLLVAFWAFVSYLLLPRLHRLLTQLYVPGYFVGRARTSDGLLGDPVNLALLGGSDQVHRVMSAGGWIRADEVSVASSWRIVWTTLRRRSYPAAPVSPLHLFDRVQDFAYQREVAGTPSRRHHVRFWRCPDGWMLPGGFPVDFLAAATFDRRVGLSLFTLQVTHKIAPDTDRERDVVVRSVTTAAPGTKLQVIANFSSGYHSRNGGGDRIETDGHLPVLDLRELPGTAAVVRAAPIGPGRRPVQTVLGVGIAMARGLSYVAIAVLAVVAPDVLDLPTDSASGLDDDTFRTALVAAALLFAVVDLGLAVAVHLARNWARLTLMSACAVTTTASFVTDLGNDDPVSLSRLPTVAGGILVLLALSSRPAREFAAATEPASGRLVR
ncbi:LssY C-terminal domain-containing protein [Nocardioides lianchengensis]|uniref:LssY C-terminus n=1 Tax=Nocardioides lianchengensis TaxID=1045774 RepID=A0A1G7C1U6_9ACTN|nr:LssY C-terminal domain-containing protein [Nocardioides lianchengensis]NYG09273.1 hypothetical protein [Nocardioides lianchengensis]SDE33249.1 LssY C-terminus [Nocardioides lianchengensis]